MRKYYIALGMFIFLFTFSYFMVPFKKVQANEKIYVVKQDDTLYAISRQFNVSVSELEKLNKLTGTVINVGQELLIPAGDGKTYYTVKAGETLYSIAVNNDLSVDMIKQLNNLSGNLIVSGQKLYLGEPSVMTVSKVVVMTESSFSNGFSKEDIELLARMIHAEARGETYEGKVAVGAVIINRIKSPDFPSSMREVIFQPTKNGYQFSPVQDGSIRLKADDISIRAAYDAINGVDPTGGSLYFYNPDLATDEWITTVPVTKRIGNHLFAR